MIADRPAERFRRAKEYAELLLFAPCLFPAVLKFGWAFFTDLRHQVIVPAAGFPPAAILAAAGATLLWLALEQEILRRANAPGGSIFAADLPLFGTAVMWFLPPTFPLLILCIALVSWSAGRAASLCCAFSLPRLRGRTAFALLCGAALLAAAVGAWQQCRSLHTLGMAWFDWGHFYECLNNFFRGKPFHLNLCGGSFLGSRFTPTLVVLLPVVATGSVPLFLFTGSLLVSSGALFTYLLARSLKFTATEALLWGLWYLILPGIANMNLPLIDGFHEVFLLFPLVLAAVWLATERRYIPAAALTLLALGVRETVGIAFAGYGIILFLRGERRTGAVLCLGSLLWVLIVLKVLMPFFDPRVAETYAHVGFYSHLGGNIAEIALSPLLRPKAFFGSLFSLHTFLFWCTLLLPFAVLIRHAPLMLLPLIPEFIMVSVDRRFDTQTVLRHYQALILIVLIVAALFGAKRLRERGTIADMRLFLAGIPLPRSAWLGAAGAAFAAAALSFFVFVQFPGLPASDPWRRSAGSGGIAVWEDVRPAMARILKLIPVGAKVTAGPRPASLLIPRYDIYFDFSPDDGKLQDFVLLENFFPFYFREDLLSRHLLRSPGWELIHQEFVDERSIQLFRRAARPVPKQPPTVKLPQREWERWGAPIPLPCPELELRGRPAAPGRLVLGVRVRRRCRNDMGFRVLLSFASGREQKYFTSFCNGRWPADFAAPGEGFFFSVEYPPQETPTNCRVDVIDIRDDTAAPQ